MSGSVSFNVISFGGIKIGSHSSFSFSSSKKSSEKNLVSAAELPLPFLRNSSNPSTITLLSWHVALSTFVGRKAQLHELEQWADEPHTMSVKFIVGDGGSGKSRLAAQFCAQLRADGWSAGFVNISEHAMFKINRKGGLLVIDYPEEDFPSVEMFLSDLARSEYPTRLRILLLTRNPDITWIRRLETSPSIDIVDTSPIYIGAMPAVELFDVFQNVLEAVSQQNDTNPLPLSLSAFSDWVSLSPENAIPLFVTAAAVHSALNPNDEIVRYSGREVVIALVKRELRRLMPLARSAGWQENFLSKLLALATFSGAINIETLVEISNALEVPGDEKLIHYLTEIGVLVDQRVSALKPDLLAAALTVEALRSDKNASGFVWMALSAVGDVNSMMARLSRIITDEKRVFGEGSEIVLSFVTNHIRENTAVISSLIPYFSQMNTPHSLFGLDEFIWREASRLSKSLDLKSTALNNLSFCLIARKEYKGAIYALREAISIDELNKGLFGHMSEYELGVKLMNLGRIYSEIGNNVDAVVTFRRAVKNIEKFSLMNGGPGEHARASLSVVFDILGRATQGTGKKGEGLRYAIRATALAKELAEQNWEKYAPEYASKIINLAIAKHVMGNLDGAHEEFFFAEDILRSVISVRPGVAEHQLASCLNDDAAIWIQKNHPEKALPKLYEAYQLWNQANTVSGSAFRSELLSCCWNIVKASFLAEDFGVTESFIRALLNSYEKKSSITENVVWALVYAAGVAIKLGDPASKARFSELRNEWAPTIDANELISRAKELTRN